MTPEAAGIVLARLSNAPTPEAAHAILLDAIDAGLDIVEAAGAWRDWSHLQAASVIVVEGA